MRGEGVAHAGTAFAIGAGVGIGIGATSLFEMAYNHSTTVQKAVDKVGHVERMGRSC